MIDFSLPLHNPFIPALLGAALLCLLYLIIFYRRFLLTPQRKGDDADNAAGAYPDLTVAVYARDNAVQLRRLLPLLFEQEYPAGLEIVIINDGEDEEIKDVFKYFSLSHNNLYLTFVPELAKSVSRRKLGITLGVKAARNNHILFIDADATPDSRFWARKMAAPYAAGKEIVLGVTHYNRERFARECSLASRLSFVATTLSWVNSALGGKPYRGDIRNIGFTRNIFMRNNGFARNLNLHGGCDDIYISEIADGDNCSVVTSRDAFVTIANGIESGRDWKAQRMSHYFTSSSLRRGSRNMFLSGSVVFWTEILALSAAVFLAPLSAVTVITAFVIALLSWIILAATFRKVLGFTEVKAAPALVPFALLAYPFSEAIWHIRARINRSREYTWS